MTTARSKLVDVSRTRWYHCISKCVRLAFLMKTGSVDRKQWIENRLKKLTMNFAIGVGGFSILDNHLHVVVRLEPDSSEEWSAEEVIRRWIEIYPPRNLAKQDSEATRDWIESHARDAERVAVLRARLGDLGWFMKALKEPLARMANQEDGCTGAFWAARYKSIAILDEAALLITAAYVDLNPLAAGMADTPEDSEHTSIRLRVTHVDSKGKLECLAAASQGSVASRRAGGNVEQDHWLIPFGDGQQLADSTEARRRGMLASFSLASYLLLVDYSGQLFREGKAHMEQDVKCVLERLGVEQEVWVDQVQKRFGCSKLRGNSFAAQHSESNTQSFMCA